MKQVFKKTNSRGGENGKLISSPFKDIYYKNDNLIIKNYLISPMPKILK